MVYELLAVPPGAHLYRWDSFGKVSKGVVLGCQSSYSRARVKLVGTPEVVVGKTGNETLISTPSTAAIGI